MVSLGVSPSLRKYFPPICPSPQPFQATRFPSSLSFHRSHKIVEGRRNYTKIPLSSGEEKHVDMYTIMNSTRNKTRTKYSKEVS